MNLYRSVRAVADSSGEAAIDWTATAEAAKAATDPGSLALDPDERAGYARDVTDACTEIEALVSHPVALPNTVQIQNRHHWIDANVETFRRVMAPIESSGGLFPGVARTVNTGTMGILLAFLGRNVLGQYDPLLLADSPQEDHALYFVRPNIRRMTDVLDTDYDRFRRWIAFHEVTHAAEFAMAPWLSIHLERHMESGIEALANGSIDTEAFRELDATMTVVEGYAELLMDHAFDDEYADLRRKLDARRQGHGPLQRLFRRVLGMGLKRRQYERGKAFFEAVASSRDVEFATQVWAGPQALPTHEELDAPAQWVARMCR